MTERAFEQRYIAARNRVIAADFPGLNEMQRKAVMATEGPLLLLAGAGSGKTTVLINRIANLLRYGRGSDTEELPNGVTEEDLLLLEAAAERPDCVDMERARTLSAIDPVEPWRIIAITFTNKAAGELKERLIAKLGAEAEDVWAMTFHSACVRILRSNAEAIGFNRNFTIYDTSDSQSVMKRVLKDLDLDEKNFPHRAVLAAISSAKDAMLTPQDYAAAAQGSSDIRRQKIADAYLEYARRLREANAMDFDDLIYNTVRLLQEHDDVRSYYQRRFRYVLIDEYQDTNNLQYLLASNLAGGYENICVVGDDDQSIYKFRGATVENILSFEQQYKHARAIYLEQNYRSTGHILGAANGVIRNNLGRKGKNLWTDHDDGDKVKLYVARNENEEAQYVASRIIASYAEGVKWSENAVLYRMNAQSNQLEYAFKRNGIPYRIIGGIRFFDRAEIKDMLAYLCVLMMPGDDLRLSRIINVPARGIGERTVEIARQLAAEEGTSLFEIIWHADQYPALQRAAVRLREFSNLLVSLQEQVKQLPADELYDLVLEKTGYITALEAKASDENLARIENVNELKSNIIAYQKETGDTGLAGFLDEVALYTDLDQMDKDADCVVMMTMHSAKGLEFPNVFLIGAEEGMFPGIRSIGEPEEMEEERRLCYVAITRARQKLYITAAKQRMLFGRTSANRLSRFVEEIPEEHIEKPSAVQRPGLYASAAKTKRAPERHPNAVSIPSAPTQTFVVGDHVTHKAFGEGTIAKMTPMGGDHLVEINFTRAGVKRLMLKAASQHMTKQ
ncbi:MAG: ATP-dependent helicase [Oscillospiraceae bacterium]|jgi:DNA helicase-2/ATP-dependent DNA helicase PcrA